MSLTRRFLLTGSLGLLATASARAGAPLTVVASSVPHAEILGFVQDKLAQDLPLRVIEISGDIRPNRIVLDGDADANFFQHVPYLRAEEKALGVSLAVTATVHVEPLGIYSRRHRALADVRAGATVALSNSVTNFGRGLTLLADHGLIRLASGTDATLATTADIVDNPKRLKFVEMAPPQLPRSLDDVALSVINGNYALEAGLIPAKDALGLERAEGNAFANVLVTTLALEHDPRVKRLSELLRSPDVAVFIRERYRGSVIPVTRI